MSSETFGIAGRYSIALFDLALENNVLKDVEKDMTQLIDMIKKNHDLEEVIENPSIARKEKLLAIMDIAKQSGFNEVSCNFVGLLAERGRLENVKIILETFFRMISKHKGEVKIEVKSATKLSKEQKDNLKSAIENEIKGKIIINTVIDKELLGGITIKIGSNLIDGSLKSKIDKLQTVMKGVG